MARIRSIKPEFWTSEKVVECSRDARLLFIGLWNFCDDGGVHPDSVKRIKMEVFPGDFDIDAESIRRMLDELEKNGLLIRYVIGKQQLIKVLGWTKHQKIDKPTYRFPQPIDEQDEENTDQLDDYSTSPHPRKGREGKGVEGNGMEGRKITTADAVVVTSSGSEDADHQSPPAQKVPVQKIVDLYHELLPELPTVQKITNTRRGHIQQRWREDLPDLTHWTNFFNYVRLSDFLMGKKPGTGDKPPFIADLEWLTKPANYAKIAEDKYHEKLRAVR